MPMPIVCPSCQMTIKVNAPDGLFGRTVKCPRCSATFTVGGNTAAAVVAAPLPTNYPAMRRELLLI